MLSGDVFLVVHAPMHLYIKYVASYIQETLFRLLQRYVDMKVFDDVSSLHFPENSIIFFIGDKCPAFDRSRNCFYVYVNFELIYRLGKFRKYSPGTSKAIDFVLRYNPFSQDVRYSNWWIQQKYTSFNSRLKCFDMILDFYRPQTSVLQKELSKTSVDVMFFPVNVSVESPCIKEVLDRKWDVCVVGSDSNRRRALYEKLARLGVRLSPMNGIDLAAAIANSKLTINVHMAPSKHFESPRIIQVLKMGCCLVTEECYGMDTIIPSDCYVGSSYNKLADTVGGLLTDTRQLGRIARNAKNFVEQQYDGYCFFEWERILERIQYLTQNKRK